MSIGYMNPVDEITSGKVDTPLLLTTTGALFTKSISYPCEIYDFYIRIAVATAGTIMVALRRTAFNQAPQVTNLATITITGAQQPNVVYRNNLLANNRVIRCFVGDLITCQLVAGGTAGEAIVTLLARRSQAPILNAAAIPNYNEVTT